MNTQTDPVDQAHRKRFAPLALLALVLAGGWEISGQLNSITSTPPPSFSTETTSLQPVERHHIDVQQTQVEPDAWVLSLDEPTTASIDALLDQHCGDCHRSAQPASDFYVSPLLTAESSADQHHQWQRMLEELRSGEMPPAEGLPLAASDRQAIQQWLINSLACLTDSDEPYPGRVTLRRLNRAEYRRTIGDLMGIDYQPAVDFPADEVGYGFDTIGDVLSLSPILLERYLEAAEEVTSLVIETEPLPEPLEERFGAAQMEAGEGTHAEGTWALALYRSTAISQPITIPEAGVYQLRVVAFGDQAGDDPVEMTLAVDGQTIETFQVPNTREQPETYTCQATLQPGVRQFEIAFTNDYYQPEAVDESQRDRNLIVNYLEISGPEDFQPPERSELHRQIVFTDPGPEITREEAARLVLERFASWAYRRPVRSDELDRLMELVNHAHRQRSTYEESLQIAAQAILVSPHFLYRVENQSDTIADGGIYTLNDFELASRLSYFLWSSMPDEELFNLAEQGALQQEAVLRQQVTRMLADPRASALSEQFASQWLQLRNLQSTIPDAAQFPSFTESLREAMAQETLLFFDHIVQNNCSVLELLAADYTFLNENLATHYGISGVEGDHFRRVDLHGTPRGGILTQASLLTVTSNPTRTSPVKRGAWILTNLLGIPPAPPPPDAGELPAGAELNGTLREQMEQHRANPRCASCHQLMDPLGFGLEQFDPIGRFRTEMNGQVIDAHGELPDGSTFAGPSELKQILLEDSRRQQFLRCLTTKLFTYGVGRGVESFDLYAIDRMVDQVTEQNYQFSALVQAIVASNAFRQRAARPLPYDNASSSP